MNITISSRDNSLYKKQTEAEGKDDIMFVGKRRPQRSSIITVTKLILFPRVMIPTHTAFQLSASLT